MLCFVIGKLEEPKAFAFVPHVVALPLRSVAAVCLDIDGTLTDGVRGPAIPGVSAATRLLRAAFPVRLVTNTTSVPHAALARHLLGLGLLEDPASLLTPAD